MQVDFALAAFYLAEQHLWVHAQDVAEEVRAPPSGIFGQIQSLTSALINQQQSAAGIGNEQWAFEKVQQSQSKTRRKGLTHLSFDSDAVLQNSAPWLLYAGGYVSKSRRY